LNKNFGRSKKLAKEDLSSSDESDYQEHNIWENGPLRWRGIDCDNTWSTEYGDKFNLFNLFKARYESFPTQKQPIEDIEVIDYMKRFSKTRNLKKNNYPWTDFEDTNNYLNDEEDTQNSACFQRFHQYYLDFYKDKNRKMSLQTSRERTYSASKDMSPEFKIRKSNLMNT
jgi:hypothetical protein